MKSRNLTKKVFNAIRNELLSNDRNHSDLAADYGVSSSTVSLVNNEGTWENHLAYTRAKKSLRQRRKDAVAKQSKKERAEKAGLHPKPREEQVVRPDVEPPVQVSLAEKLRAENERPITFQEFRTNNLSISRRIRDVKIRSRANSIALVVLGAAILYVAIFG